MDKTIDDEIKCTCITNTLQGQKDMDSAIHHAITTELTRSGFRGTAVTTRIPWTNIYNTVLSTAKMLDSTRERRSGSERFLINNVTPQWYRNTVNTLTTPTPYTNYTGTSGHETWYAVQSIGLETVDCCPAKKR
jgi:hypothetical protein